MTLSPPLIPHLPSWDAHGTWRGSGTTWRFSSWAEARELAAKGEKEGGGLYFVDRKFFSFTCEVAEKVGSDGQEALQRSQWLAWR